MSDQKMQTPWQNVMIRVNGFSVRDLIQTLQALPAELQDKRVVLEHFEDGQVTLGRLASSEGEDGQIVVWLLER